MEYKQTQRQRILQILSDFKPHCLTHEMYCKDDRTRISELRKLGYIFDETLGNCIDPNHHHGAGLKLRKILNNPLHSDIPVKTILGDRFIERNKLEWRPNTKIKQQTLL